MRTHAIIVSLVIACGCDLRSGAPTVPITTPTPTVSAVVSGVVRDTVSGQPISWAEVEWKGLAEVWGDRGDGAIADADGVYRLEIRNLGRAGAAEYQIEMRAKKSGYVADTHVVTLSAAADARSDFQLEAVTTRSPLLAPHFSTISTTRSACTSSITCFAPDGHSTSTRVEPLELPRPKGRPACDEDA